MIQVGENKSVIEQAINNTPCLIIDCANRANPHNFFQYQDYFHEVYIIEVELMYKFRDVLKQSFTLINTLQLKSIAITSWKYLFNYQNEKENKEILLHAEELITELSKHVLIYKGMSRE
ncbi:hypothetical protein COV16_05115 [Candidatus Woesearchaeota archaeon CG10_big_fil_rev_8_21_14_0_10_34_8]|nr:MAG: hypothetical protein COV16_05115 [Candidatus Woesearchaeota archaeon CG10_big_fil_rev_8_21_14_0_10_34_8]